MLKRAMVAVAKNGKDWLMRQLGAEPTEASSDMHGGPSTGDSGATDAMEDLSEDIDTKEVPKKRRRASNKHVAKAVEWPANSQAQLYQEHKW
ncbi:hypothetical protein NDU88_003855 [Pleurodeles waltl]|uniref:Uncharacterized protein n=1 Tax=Pleurodeles waltl TaxID=8319 RepID=A0AAV7KWP8_PLEWA|nr:hypothetical protein NDU88_003855 [Pleurodeles waltl]